MHADIEEKLIDWRDAEVAVRAAPWAGLGKERRVEVLTQTLHAERDARTALLEMIELHNPRQFVPKAFPPPSAPDDDGPGGGVLLRVAAG